MTVQVSTRSARILRVRYAASPSGPTAVIVRLAGAVVAEVRLDAGAEVLDADHEIGEALAGAGDPAAAELSFTAAEALSTPGIGLVRLLR
jgi:hypothetical protein